MSIAESFYTVLAGTAAITNALASANAIFPHELPQEHDGFPAITYGLTGEEDISLLNGGISDTHRATLECRIWARSFKSCNDIATIIKGELIGKLGTFGSNTAVHIRKSDGGEISLPAEADTGLHSVRLQFDIAYS